MLNNKERKMLFFDIDGTLTTEDGNHTLPDSTVEAIRQARAKGHLAYINTGRVLCNIEPMIRNIGFDGYVCGCGTNVISEGEELLYHRIPQDTCKRIARKCREFGFMALFEHRDQTGYDPMVPGQLHTQILKYFLKQGKKVVDDIESDEFAFDKFAFWYEADNPHLAEFRDFVSEDFNCIEREGDFWEVVPKGFSKATGIQVLMDRYHIPLQNIYVFGDSNNDLDMLRYVPHSIAMGECSDAVAAVASYRTDTILNDGIYKAMKHFSII